MVGASAWSVELATKRTNRAAAEVQAGEIAGAIERQAATTRAYLQSTSALFMSSMDVSPAFFQEFVDRLRLPKHLTGVLGMGWSETIMPGDVAKVERRMIEQGHIDFRIYPKPRRDARLLQVITMLQPETPPNRIALGFDMYSEARRAAAMDRARRTNAVAASDPVHLIQDGNTAKSPGFLVYMPVRTLGPENRFKGYVYSPIRTREFIAAAVETRMPEEGRVDIYDLTSQGQELIYTSGKTGHSLGSPAEQRLAVFDQQWLLRYYPPGGTSLGPLTLVVLVGGISFALLLLAYILLVQRRNEDLEALVSAQAERETERAAFVRELNHRVKNSLANVTSIISLTRRNAADLNSFTDNLLERVRALAASHSLLDGAQWGPTDLKGLVEAQLSSPAQAGRIHIDGPSILISPNDALSIGLALHELLTNATRYGALSTEDGRVDISWHIAGSDLVAVSWRESGGPAVTEPKSRGFGLNLIQRALAQELGSPITIEFAESGLRCQFAIPLRKPKSFRLRQ
ncbi:CHASE domain-containing protein [Sphingobium lignivorans]|uniref:histidine kinase n=1 Tax=Sphingobium lignivorans TaxID=2735886 RepID=A0ABR6NCJ3_9SPHN|nr:CHASE domain-containing protein [Sphingobium lignivorans]MBB5985005.1 two-component sensor histidine kinase [Sphingobium lignivorans]